jgi:hypothetical protein
MNIDGNNSTMSIGSTAAETVESSSFADNLISNLTFANDGGDLCRSFVEGTLVMDLNENRSAEKEHLYHAQVGTHRFISSDLFNL